MREQGRNFDADHIGRGSVLHIDRTGMGTCPAYGTYSPSRNYIESSTLRKGREALSIGNRWEGLDAA